MSGRRMNLSLYFYLVCRMKRMRMGDILTPSTRSTVDPNCHFAGLMSWSLFFPCWPYLSVGCILFSFLFATHDPYLTLLVYVQYRGWPYWRSSHDRRIAPQRARTLADSSISTPRAPWSDPTSMCRPSLQCCPSLLFSAQVRLPSRRNRPLRAPPTMYTSITLSLLETESRRRGPERSGTPLSPRF